MTTTRKWIPGPPHVTMATTSMEAVDIVIRAKPPTFLLVPLYSPSHMFLGNYFLRKDIPDPIGIQDLHSQRRS
jgi:hypothetical protein